MARFGGYDAVKELYRTGFATVYAARQTGQTAETLAVKVYQPSVRLQTAELTARQVRAFIDAARIQNTVATADARHWAPIHADGATKDGAFYVTDRCSSSLRQLIDGRLNVTEAGLRNIVTSLVHGLVSLKQACHRPHGNLKSSNVLIASVAPLPRAQIVLCDPLPSEYIDPDAHWTTDLRDIAEFIYQLVMHQPTPVTRGWQIPDSEKWKTLGKQGDYWRNLCNRLLSLETHPDAVTLEDVAQELAALPAPSTPALRYVLAGCMGVALVVVLTWFIWRGPESSPENFAAWSDAIRWVIPLRLELDSAKDSDLQRLWATEMETVREPLGQDDPRYDLTYDQRDQISANPLPTLQAMRPDDWQDVVEKASNRKVGEAVAVLEKFFFDKGKRYEYWPWLSQLHQIRKEFEKRQGCKPEAAYLARLLDEGMRWDPPAEGSTRIHVDQLCWAVKEAIAIRGVWDTNAVDFAELDNDAIANLRDPGKPITQAQDLDARLEELKARLTELKDYYRLKENPLDRVKARLTDANNAIARARDSGADVNDLSEAIAAQDPAIASLEQLAAIQKNYAKLESGSTPILTDVNDIVERATEKIGKPLEWYGQISENDIAGLVTDDLVNAEWLRRRAYWLGGPDAAGRTVSGIHNRSHFETWQEADNRRDFLKLKEQVEQTRYRLIALDRALPAELMTAAGAPNWQVQLSAVYRLKRTEALRHAIGRISKERSDNEVFPDPNDPTVSARYLDRIEQVKDWHGRMPQLIADYSQVEQGLSDFKGDTETLPETDRTLGALDMTWRRDDTVWDPNVERALARLTETLDGLRRIDTLADPNAIMALANGVSNEWQHQRILYAAWKRLGQLDDWPATLSQAEQDRAIQETLAGIFTSLQAGRARELRNALALESVTRHNRIIARESRGDPTLRAFSSLEPPFDPLQELDENAVAVLERFEVLAENVAQFVADPNWQSTQYNMLAFYEPNEQGLGFPPRTAVTPATMRAWLDMVTTDYRVIADPRDPNQWDDRVARLRERITEGLGEVQENERQKLQDDLQLLSRLDAAFSNVRKRPAITKYTDDINQWDSLLNATGASGQTPGLVAVELRVASHIKPPAYRHLDRQNGILVFIGDARMDGFLPIKFQNGQFGPLPVASWQDLDATADFGTNGTGDTATHWPNFIRSTADPSVKLRLVTAENNASVKPFYMSLREITNEQYVTFLTRQKPADTSTLLVSGGPRYDPSRYAIDSTANSFSLRSDADPCAPVTWVTRVGAEAYAAWVPATLPAYRQFQAAYESAYSNSRNLHVRSTAWQDQVDVFSGRTIGQKIAMPVGVASRKEPWLNGMPNQLDREAIVPVSGSPGTPPSQWWPRSVDAGTPQDQICDLVGNVWEWCRNNNDRVILCGGSCLSPPALTAVTAIYGDDTDEPINDWTTGCDVGFRLVVALPQSPDPLAGRGQP